MFTRIESRCMYALPFQILSRSICCAVLSVLVYMTVNLGGYGITNVSAQELTGTDNRLSSFFAVLLPQNVETLDSQHAADPASLTVIRNIQEGLYEWDSVADAEHYWNSFPLKLMKRRSIPDTLKYKITEIKEDTKQ